MDEEEIYFLQREVPSTLLGSCCAALAERSDLPPLAEEILRDVYDPGSSVEGSRAMYLKIGGATEWDRDHRAQVGRAVGNSLARQPTRWGVLGGRGSGKSTWIEFLLDKTAEQRGVPFRRIGHSTDGDTAFYDLPPQDFRRYDAWEVDLFVGSRDELNVFRNRLLSSTAVRADLFVGLQYLCGSPLESRCLAGLRWMAFAWNPSLLYHDRIRRCFLPWMNESLFRVVLEAVTNTPYSFLVLDRRTRKLYRLRAPDSFVRRATF